MYDPPYYQKFLLLETNRVVVVLLGSSIMYNDKCLKVSVKFKVLYQLEQYIELYSTCKGVCSIYDKHFTYWSNIWGVCV